MRADRESSLLPSGEPLHTSAEALRAVRRMKYNPMPRLSPKMLTRALEAFEVGDIKEAAALWEIMARRDDTLSSVKPKREKHVSQLDRQVMALPDSGADGEAHRKVLEDFWNNVRAVNAFDRNDKGGFRKLVKQMMTAESFFYSAHHIIWQPGVDKLRATFEFVPLWLFENRTGSLRYLKTPTAMEGEVLAPHEWMITCGTGLMMPCSIGYLAKRSAYNDWLIFSERFSVPGRLGRTTGSQDSPEGRAMRAAVDAFGHDFSGVLYNDDGTHEKPIEIIQAEGNPSGMPMPAVVERVDRRNAALYRGADLSSMSSKDGEGTGASLQEKETGILLRDDAETINETLHDISRLVIEWHFGYGVEPLARLELIVPTAEDGQKVLSAATSLADRGAPVSQSALMDRLSIQKATDESDRLQGRAQRQLVNVNPRPVVRPPADPEQVINADDALAEDLQELRSALAEDMRPLGDALWDAYQTNDLPAMSAALKRLSADLPDLAGADRLIAVLSDDLTRAWLGDETDDSRQS